MSTGIRTLIDADADAALAVDRSVGRSVRRTV
jgi:hypothetical protein